MTDDDARWAEALTALERGPTPLIRARVRRLRLVVLGVVVLMLIPALTIPFLLPDRPDRPAGDDPAPVLEVAGLVVMGWRSSSSSPPWSSCSGRTADVG